MLDRRNLLAGLATTVALAACGRGGGADAQVLRVGSQKGGTKSLMLASGVLDGAPYKVEWSEFPAAQNLLEALGSSAVDLGLVGDAPFQFAYQAGSPIKAVGAQRTQTRLAGALSILVPARSPVHDGKGLKGKRIATTRGSVGHYLVLRSLIASGLRSEDVRIVFLSPSDSRAALQSGAVDAWSTWMPYVAAAQAEGDRIVVDGKDFVQGYGFEVAPESAIASKREQLSDFLRREAKALEWAKGHVDQYGAVLAKETGLPPQIARATAEKNVRLRVPIDNGVIKDQQVVLSTFQKFGEVKSARSLDNAFELNV
ncbi:MULTISPECIES: ABC transporter substrate-binding protein [Novosphingobium]|uniref:Putative aliphatic sulfonates-binding protein n=1 Tax=Novosphingobium pentaromativorans TaxID=205844 RepID=A0A2W5QFD1_9SPHN|nr:MULTISPECIES: ABC transporter substrate-binding protein [Novosphingobium]PZQ53443.1 MAG: ABC transporter substrate-binding protein [Novosphingobium pentaromativorans]GFE75464.1 sulfonate ABC transporter substrate-binding protein [Novosphingobium sp. TCA1]